VLQARLRQSIIAPSVCLICPEVEALQGTAGWLWQWNLKRNGHSQVYSHTPDPWGAMCTTEPRGGRRNG
jgi:hypothetical protein